MDKIKLGLVEEVELLNSEETKQENVSARIDTGAMYSSVDIRIASKLNLGPIVGYKKVKSANGNSLRPIVEAKIKIKDKIIETKVTLADRDRMTYSILIGVNLLNQGFIVDPSVNDKVPRE